MRLAFQGAEVSVVEVGPTLAAIQEHGLRVIEKGGTFSAKVHATSDPSTLGPQDLVIVAVKGPTLKFIAPKIAPLLCPTWFGAGAGASAGALSRIACASEGIGHCCGQVKYSVGAMK